MASIKAGLVAATATLSLTVGAAAARTIEVASGPGGAERLQEALIDAKAGDVVQLGEGRFAVADSLSLDARGVRLRGRGQDKTVLDFSGQTAGGDGLLVTGDGAVLEDFAVENAKGNGVKAKGVDGVVFRRLRVEWTGGPKASNGAYGVYPVSSHRVLIEGVTVKGASDAGIYVGQSKEIIVRDSVAAFNVAGIEIENCYNAEVRDNLATHNAGGILVFDLPGLPQMGGHDVRVVHNRVLDNDTPNFAPKGNIVAAVPTGTGVMIMANRDVAVVDNRIDGNQSAAVLLVAYLNAFEDPTYNPLPRRVSVRANQIGRNGYAPAFDGGPFLAKMLGGAIPPVLWDGVTAYKAPGGPHVETAAEFAVTDGPVVNLQLVEQGRPVSDANPKVAPQMAGAALVEPRAVDLGDLGRF